MKQEPKPQPKRPAWIFYNKAAYLTFARKDFLPWFRDMTQKYKARGIFPSLPSDIVTLYSDQKDREAALLSSIIIPYTKSVRKNIREIAGIISESPYKFFVEEKYKTLSTGNTMNKLFFGSPRMPYWSQMPFFDDIARLLRKKNITESDMCKIRANADAVQMAIAVAFSNDGVGVGLFEATEPVRCPNTSRLRKFLFWLTGVKCRESEFCDMTEVFFENSIDFMYSYFAWKELEHLYSAEMTLLEDRYKMFLRWEGTFTDRWESVLFDVDFNNY